MDYDHRLSKPELTLSSFCIFWHTFLLHIRLPHYRFLMAVIFLFLEPKVKVLWRALDLRDTDGDGV